MSNEETDLFERIKRVKQKVASKNVFLNPPLAEKEIEAFERQYHIQIPEACREFILQIGNGGQGPGFDGLVTLQQMFPERVRKGSEFRPDMPFPLTEYWELPFDDPEANDERLGAAFCHGHLYLCTDGCDYDWVLIVTGEERGNVWMTSSAGIAPCRPRIDFLGWYEHWLDVGDESFYPEELIRI